MAVFVIVERVEMKDPSRFQRYLDQVSATIERRGGRYHVVSDEIQTLEGEWRPHGLVIFSFPTRDDALAWWSSDEYAPLKALRRESVVDNIVLVDGL